MTKEEFISQNRGIFKFRHLNNEEVELLGKLYDQAQSTPIDWDGLWKGFENMVDNSYPVTNEDIIAYHRMFDYLKRQNLVFPVMELDNTDLRNKITELVCKRIQNWDGKGKFLSTELQDIAEEYHFKVKEPTEKQKQNELYENMQYYMEYCQQNGYVTPMEWIEKHKHF